MYIAIPEALLPGRPGKSVITWPLGCPQGSVLCESLCTGRPGHRSNLEPICAPSKKTVFDDCVFSKIVKMYVFMNDVFISRPPAYIQG